MTFTRLVARDWRRAWASGAAVPPVFFLLVATLFPFAVGPDSALLARVGGGVVWTAALLASLLPIERLVAPDLDGGMIDHLRLRGVSEPVVAAAKVLAHWLAFAPPLMAATVIAAGLLGLSAKALAQVEVALLLGTPGLAALAVATAALTASSRGGSAVAGPVMLPLAVPLLIFGGGADQPGAFKLLAAVSLLLVAGAPFVAGAAMRMRD